MSRKIAFTGIFTSVAVILLYLSAIMPTGKLTLYFLASLPVALTVIEFGAVAGISVYFATCILSALIAGNILGIVPFVLFFGHYPILKFFIEKGRRAVAEVILKLAVFNISGLLWYLLFENLFIEALPSLITGSSVLLVGFIVVLQPVFFIYDYMFSRLLFYYHSKVGIIKRR
ncbi:MAG TPA: hypothetical protein VEG39_03905 [Clostridia bacterium]|nr:hypothetical protein [Clostridia bacterium]